MPCWRAWDTTAGFCSRGCSSIWLVAISCAPMASMACCCSATGKLEMPMARVRPSALACIRASKVSVSGTAAPGDGQWISVRSSCSVRSLARLSRRLGSNCARPRFSVQILVVRNS
ncbi:hypothetical protein D3C71_1700530 [compost metagenome]